MKGDSMNIFKRMITTAMAVGVAVSLSSPCVAADNVFKKVFEDSLYGGLAGTLVGVAFMAFAEKPTDHFDYAVYGAASGVLVGAAYGMVGVSRSLAVVDNGKVTFAFPTIVPSLQEAGSGGQVVFMFKAELIRGTF